MTISLYNSSHMRVKLETIEVNLETTEINIEAFHKEIVIDSREQIDEIIKLLNNCKFVTSISTKCGMEPKIKFNEEISLTICMTMGCAHGIINQNGKKIYVEISKEAREYLDEIIDYESIFNF